MRKSHKNKSNHNKTPRLYFYEHAIIINGSAKDQK